MNIIRSVVCAMSGGVDSSIAALLLKRNGYNVTGVFMRNWDTTDETGFCSVDRDAEDAARVCGHLDVPFCQVNFTKDYWQEVFSEFLADYENGMTPNPDILCNSLIKFDRFFNHAVNELGADAVATGHYARTTFGNYLEHYKHDTSVKLLQAADPVKDQTFFLSHVKQIALRRAMFPLGDLRKTKVKQMASEAGLDFVANKKESMGICFIGKRDYQTFIKEYLESKPGYFYDIGTGEIVGRHDGIHNWTLGQCCHLGGFAKKYYVAKKIPSSQDIIVAAGHDHPALYASSMETGKMHWIDEGSLKIAQNGSFRCQFRFQHGKPLVGCTATLYNDGHLHLELDIPQMALTPGQYAVLYSGEECLGGARITNPGPSLYELSGNETQEQSKERRLSSRLKSSNDCHVVS